MATLSALLAAVALVATLGQPAPTCGAGEACAEQDDLAMLQASSSRRSDEGRRRRKCSAESGSDTTISPNVKGPFSTIAVNSEFDVKFSMGGSDSVMAKVDSGLARYVQIVTNDAGDLSMQWASDLPCHPDDVDDPEVTVTGSGFPSRITASNRGEFQSRDSVAVTAVSLYAAGDSQIKVEHLGAQSIFAYVDAHSDIDLKHSTAGVVDVTASGASEVENGEVEKLTVSASGRNTKVKMIVKSEVSGIVSDQAKLKIKGCYMTQASAGYNVTNSGGQVEFDC